MKHEAVAFLSNLLVKITKHLWKVWSIKFIGGLVFTNNPCKWEAIWTELVGVDCCTPSLDEGRSSNKYPYPNERSAGSSQPCKQNARILSSSALHDLGIMLECVIFQFPTVNAVGCYMHMRPCGAAVGPHTKYASLFFFKIFRSFHLLNTSKKVEENFSHLQNAGLSEEHLREYTLHTYIHTYVRT